ncbi:MAG: hypothetical protein FWE42_01255 [Defluviitaleaceae bacterium]|nr:hypothetical protein [Defluviitaleaceae bacterium]
MTGRLGTKKYDIMGHFDSDNLDIVLTKFMQVMDDYALEYEKAGREIKYYDSFEALYDDFMCKG